MALSSEALEIIAYLETAHGKSVSLAEISRRAGGRRRFEASPGWARGLMMSLVDAGLIEVNARGHYRIPLCTDPHAHPQAVAQPATPPSYEHRGAILGDDYFPSSEESRVVGDDYFPTAR